MRILLVLVLVVAIVVGGGAVGFLAFGDSDDSGDNGSTAVQTPAGSGTPAETDLTAEQVLDQAARATEAVTSFHFELTHENGSTPLPLNLGLESAEGDIVVPDRMQADVDADALGVNVSVDVIGIENQTWVTNPFTRQWQELPNTNIRDFADPAALVQGLLPSIEDPQLSDGGSVDGAATHKVTGAIDSGALQDALGIAEPGHEVTVEAWVGKDDYLPRRVQLSGPLSDAEEPNVVRRVEISRYNEAVEIMPPE